jgi:hypothetical protein
MLAFPDIQLPDLGGFSEQLIDATISTPMEAGYKQTRPRYTRDRHIWSLPWEETPLTDADYLLLKAFFSTVRIGATIFIWEHSFRKTSHDVRFASISEFVPVSVGGVPGHRGRVVLEEV